MADSVDDWLIRENAAKFPRRACPIKQIDRGAGKKKAGNARGIRKNRG